MAVELRNAEREAHERSIDTEKIPGLRSAFLGGLIAVFALGCLADEEELELEQQQQELGNGNGYDLRGLWCSPGAP